MLSEDGAWSQMGELEGPSSPEADVLPLAGFFDVLSGCVTYASDRILIIYL